MVGINASSWGTNATEAPCLLCTGLPFHVTLPVTLSDLSEACAAPDMTDRSVVLPQPDGPRIPVTLPLEALPAHVSRMYHWFGWPDLRWSPATLRCASVEPISTSAPV